MTAGELRAFEADIASEFNAGRIRAPVHLYDGCEELMIGYFRGVGPDDWVFCSWRSHYQCLLKGVPPDLLKEEIMAGHSISLCFPEQRILSSAIVGGVLPIALGRALAIKREGGAEKVHCFMGDMTAATGIAHECIKYAHNFDLPITFILEDNRVSVCTDTYSVWNGNLGIFPTAKIFRYEYKSKWPHAGAGQRVQF